jgi:FtsH-binding integral membrane protein
MYGLVLLLHSWIRWAVLAAGLYATFVAAADPAGARAARTDRAGLAFVTLVDVQLLLGLLLYLVLSPFTKEALRDFGAAMHNSGLRFWGLEHPATALVAIVLVHVGRVLARTAKTPASRRVRQMVCFGLATVLIIVGIPWPGMPNGRPLLRV